MTGYTKLFGSILASTIWQESKETKLIWITMLAASNKNGEIEASVPGLAHMACLTIAETESALETLLAPDPYSRTPEHQGRRIAPIPGGWRLLNHGKYREKMNEAERREYNRLKQIEARERKKSPEAVNAASANVSSRQQMSALSAHTDADTDTDTKAVKNKEAPQPPPGESLLLVPDSPKPSKSKPANLEEVFEYADTQGIKHGEAEDFWDKMEAKGWKVNRQKIADWRAQMRTYHRSGWLNDKPKAEAPADKYGPINNRWNNQAS
jgi:hypothetical protein